jgi:thiosulfate/3-mercaptopyruvate sulfurtransferase
MLPPSDAGRHPFPTPEAFAEAMGALGIGDGTDVVSYCGGGVTACHNLLVMEHAGLGPGRLFPGSWSQRSRDSARPVESGRDHPAR